MCLVYTCGGEALRDVAGRLCREGASRCIMARMATLYCISTGGLVSTDPGLGASSSCVGERLWWVKLWGEAVKGEAVGERL